MLPSVLLPIVRSPRGTAHATSTNRLRRLVQVPCTCSHTRAPQQRGSPAGIPPRGRATRGRGGAGRKKAGPRAELSVGPRGGTVPRALWPVHLWRSQDTTTYPQVGGQRPRPAQKRRDPGRGPTANSARNPTASPRLPRSRARRRGGGHGARDGRWVSAHLCAKCTSAVGGAARGGIATWGFAGGGGVDRGGSPALGPGPPRFRAHGSTYRGKTSGYPPTTRPSAGAARPARARARALLARGTLRTARATRAARPSAAGRRGGGAAAGAF